MTLAGDFGSEVIVKAPDGTELMGASGGVKMVKAGSGDKSQLNFITDVNWVSKYDLLVGTPTVAQCV